MPRSVTSSRTRFRSARVAGNSGIGDVFINYRYQLSVEGPGRPAISPRVSIIIPTGSETDGIGEGVVGWQVNVPFSKQHGDFYYHWGGGFTWLPGVEDRRTTRSIC